MSLASRVHEKLRARLKRLVEKERQQLGCAKAAISKIARHVFMSPASIYRAVNGYGDVQFKAVSQTAILMLSLGITKAAARMKSKRQPASTLHA
jgi:DNA-binding phage protein